MVVKDAQGREFILNFDQVIYMEVESNTIRLSDGSELTLSEESAREFEEYFRQFTHCKVHFAPGFIQASQNLLGKARL